MPAPAAPYQTEYTVRADGFTDGLLWCKCWNGSGGYYWAQGNRDTAIAEFAKTTVPRFVYDAAVPPNLKGVSYLTLIEIGTRTWNREANKWYVSVIDTVTEYSFYVNDDSDRDEQAAINPGSPIPAIYQGPFPEDLAPASYKPVDLLVIPCAGKTFTRIAGTVAPAFKAYGNDQTFVYGESPAPNFDGGAGGVNTLVYPPDCYVFAFRTPPGDPGMLSGKNGAIAQVEVICDPDVPQYARSQRHSDPDPTLGAAVSYAYDVETADGIVRHGDVQFRPTSNLAVGELWYDTVNNATTKWDGQAWQPYTDGFPVEGYTQTLYSLLQTTPAITPFIFANYGVGQFTLYQSGARDPHGIPLIYAPGYQFGLVPPWIEEAADYEMMIVLRLFPPDVTREYFPFGSSPDVTGGFIAADLGIVVSGTHYVTVRTQYNDPIDGQVYANDWLVTGPDTDGGGQGGAPGGDTQTRAATNLLLTDVTTSRDVDLETLHNSSQGNTNITAVQKQVMVVTNIELDEDPNIVGFDWEHVTETVYRHTMRADWVPGSGRQQEIFVVVDIPARKTNEYKPTVWYSESADGNPANNIPHESYLVNFTTQFTQGVNKPAKLTSRHFVLPATATTCEIEVPPGSTVRFYVRGLNIDANGNAIPSADLKDVIVIPDHGTEDPNSSYLNVIGTFIKGEDNL